MHRFAHRARQTAWAVLPITLRMSPEELTFVVASSQLIYTDLSRRIGQFCRAHGARRSATDTGTVGLVEQW
ncbi:hypothetical protein SAMN05518849_114127 [Sphingobium sp. AP50]|nr:hypothetical protein SAMN05518849_114127 [Sphingobium sp. AP50]